MTAKALTKRATGEWEPIGPLDMLRWLDQASSAGLVSPNVRLLVERIILAADNKTYTVPVKKYLSVKALGAGMWCQRHTRRLLRLAEQLGVVITQQRVGTHSIYTLAPKVFEGLADAARALWEGDCERAKASAVRKAAAPALPDSTASPRDLPELAARVRELLAAYDVDELVTDESLRRLEKARGADQVLEEVEVLLTAAREGFRLRPGKWWRPRGWPQRVAAARNHLRQRRPEEELAGPVWIPDGQAARAGPPPELDPARFQDRLLEALRLTMEHAQLQRVMNMVFPAGLRDDVVVLEVDDHVTARWLAREHLQDLVYAAEGPVGLRTRS